MKTKLVLCPLFALFLQFAVPQILHAVPQMMVPEDTYNFGTVNQGEVVTKKFTLKNNGDELLEIRRVVPSCGCTVSEVEKSALGPGEETSLEVKLDTRGFSGEKVKTVRISTNDPKRITHLITLKGVVQPEVLVAPQRIYFGEVVGQKDSDNWPTQQATIKVRADSKASLGEIITRSKWLDITVQKDGPREKQLIVKLNPEVKPGEFRDRVVVAVKGSQQKTINLPIYASVRGSVQVKPSTLSFGIIKGVDKRKKVLRVISKSKTPLKFRSVRSDHPAVEAVVAVEAVSAGDKKADFALEVTLDPALIKKDLKTVLRISTESVKESAESGEGEEEILVSVTAVLPPQLLEKNLKK